MIYTCIYMTVFEKVNHMGAARSHMPLTCMPLMFTCHSITRCAMQLMSKTCTKSISTVVIMIRSLPPPRCYQRDYSYCIRVRRILVNVRTSINIRPYSSNPGSIRFRESPTWYMNSRVTVFRAYLYSLQAYIGEPQSIKPHNEL
jgi:hypothetical protein